MTHFLKIWPEYFQRAKVDVIMLATEIKKMNIKVFEKDNLKRLIK